MKRVITYTLVKDEKYKKHLEVIKYAREKIKEMKESGIIDVEEIFQLGRLVAMSSSNLNWR